MPALDGRVAIITGASSGIGDATARLLASEGATVVLAARRHERLGELREAIAEQGGHALAVQTDVTVRSEVEAMVRLAGEMFERVDILVNNAGIMPLSLLRKGRVDDWEAMIDVNVKGVLYCIAAVLPGMLADGGGHIVNVGSLSGRRPFPGGTVYAATKFAVRALSAGLRLELSPNDNVRVTDIEPGVVATELTEGIPDKTIRERFAKTWQERTPLDAADVARAIFFVLTQPAHVNVNEMLIRPTQQET